MRLPDRTGTGDRLKVPHAGWNTARAASGPDQAPGIPGLDDGAYFYFTHAYAAPVTEAAAAITEYGVPFASAVRRGNISGVQFHPEKSGAAGLAVLRAFIEGTRS